MNIVVYSEDEHYYYIILEMLYFSVILCIRQCFITVTVHTIRGTNIPHVSLHYMFRSDGAIFRYVGVLQSAVSLSATLPTLASVYTLGVSCMYGLHMPRVAKCRYLNSNPSFNIHKRNILIF
jgi:hypothetical protein